MKLSLFPEPAVQAARTSVANWWRENAKAVRKSDSYAAHVTEKEKDDRLRNSLSFAAEIEAGMHDSNFTVWQRIYAELTGDCIGLLP